MLTVTVENAQVLDVLDSISSRLSNLSPAMESIGQTMQSRVSARFESETDPLGHPWAPWAASTRASYPKGGNRRILDRYNDMLNGLSHRADATSARIGFDKYYATYHEFGTEKMPRRGLLMADPDSGTLAPGDEAAVLDILSTFLSPSKETKQQAETDREVQRLLKKGGKS